MTYEAFLFSQLFMNHIENNETEYQNLEYDLIYPIILDERIKFLASNYNVNILSEYDCIINYLTNEIK